ncbi:MAG: hypothetical protein LBQ22_12265 [Bacteroidales bacterium]|jgi:hypothetical protein|nr:hypothetical protein [Bacteroidales bacterium]
MQKLTVILKQHTPLIHFQHDQEGATLRASEVKPKLDKFIIKRIGGRKIVQDKGWLIANEDVDALDYKLHFTPIGDKEIFSFSIDTGRINQKGKPVFDNFPMFFGNMGDDNNLKEMVYYPQGITINIFTLKVDLREYIKSQLNDFFITTNFGTRQSKGFGSFYPISDGDPVLKSKYSFEIELSKEIAIEINRAYFKEVFLYLDYFYKTLRSGINQQGLYFKSLMFHYAKSKQEQWDKKTIRDKFQHYKSKYKDLKKQRTEFDGTFNTEFPSKDYLFRDLLGLSSSQSWLYYGDTITKSCSEKDDKGKDLIERFKSPLTIKPIQISNNKIKVYLIANQIEKEYLGSSFDINSSTYHPRNKEDKLKLKIFPEFDLEEYLIFVTEFDITTCVNDKNHRIYKKYIEPIYKQFKI